MPPSALGNVGIGSDIKEAYSVVPSFTIDTNKPVASVTSETPAASTNFDYFGAAAEIASIVRPNVSVFNPAPFIEVEVVVVGAGFSGLMAAHDLQKAGIETVVLEARHRVGGRSWSTQLESGPGIVDLGGAWINKKTQPKIYELTENFGLETEEQFTDGVEVLQGLDGIPVKLDGSLPSDPNALATAERIQHVMTLIEEAAEKRDIRVWDDFPEEEDVSVADWVYFQNASLWEDPTVRAQVTHFTTSIVGRLPHEVGAHYYLDYIKSGFGWTSLISEGEEGAQSLKLKKGTSSISDALASAMEPASIIIHSPVDNVTQSDDSVTVTNTAGQTFKAKKVILANPTYTYTKIDFSPPLPEEKYSLVSQTKYGLYAKVILTYKKSWWKDVGLVGKFTSLIGPINFSWDISDEELEQYSIAFFVTGETRNKWSELSLRERENSVIEHFATLVGPKLADKARDVLEVNYMDWTNENWLEGAPTGVMGPGVLKAYGSELRKPFGNVHIGGSEAAFEWKGYFEGAITSGQRVAQEVIASLQE